ncbi:MAG: IclR family transcriptional regulator [Alphaproteobacteria bacterium]
MAQPRARAIEPAAAPAPAPRDGTAGPLSLTRILHILEILSRHDDGRSLAELCRALDAPRSSTFALIRPLVTLGYLTRDGGRYRLGPASLLLALGIVGTRGPDQIVHSILEGLADRTELTVMYSEFLREEAVIVHRQVIQSQRAIRFVAHVGQRRPLAMTAGGRAVLSACEPQWIRRYLDASTQPRLRPGSPARKRYADMLDQVRLRGYATSLGEFTEGVGAVAAPVLGPDGRPVASVGASGPVADVADNLQRIAGDVLHAARTLSQAAHVLMAGTAGQRA